MRYQITPGGPCMCGATDCPSCGPAQGYTILSEDAMEGYIQSEIAQMRASPVLVGEALGSLSGEEYATTDRLVFDAIDGERITGFDPKQLQAIGEHLVMSVLRHFDEQARAL